MAKDLLKKMGYNDIVIREKKKIFIYPGDMDKMRGLANLNVHPYIAMGDEINDIQMLRASTFSVTSCSGVDELKHIVKYKNGFCSMKNSHEAAAEMLYFAYKTLVDQGMGK